MPAPVDNREFIRKRVENLRNNPAPRIPVALCLDNSGSMAGDPINELNAGIKLFYEAVLSDEVVMYSVDLCIISFDDEAVIVQDFCTISEQPEPPTITTRQGATFMGEAVNLTLDLLEKRKQEFRDNGIDYYQPWLVLMTDAEPYGEEPSVTESAMKRTSQMINERKLTIFPVGIGPKANRDVLKRFSPLTDPLKLNGLNFKKFFTMLSKSVAATANSSGVVSILPEPGAFEDWNQLQIH